MSAAKKLKFDAVAVPSSWRSYRDALAANVPDLGEGTAHARKMRENLGRKTTRLRKLLLREPSGPARSHLPAALNAGLLKLSQLMRRQEAHLLRNIDDLARDFEHAEINEDRVVVLVFGAVNAGKSALANHVAGLDFGLPPEDTGHPFLMKQPVDRLEEKPVECTRDYQGFRMPGLLWIDCPGVLSTRVRNSRLAQRLVARADYILLVSHSDAPLTESELKEISRLVLQTGNRDADACLVITKADEFAPGPERIVRKKSGRALEDQMEWCRYQLKQLEDSGLNRVLKMRKPIFTSTYLARAAMGRDCETGRAKHDPENGWSATYQSSGMPELFEFLEKSLTKDPAALKAGWTKKRELALRLELQAAGKEAQDQLDEVIKAVREQRRELRKATAHAMRFAAEEAQRAVEGRLEKQGIREFSRFQQESAEKSLQRLLRAAILKATAKFMRPLLRQADKRIGGSVAEFLRKTEFKLDLKEKLNPRTKETTETGKEWGTVGGSMAGGWAGAQAGAMLGTLVAGPLGTGLGGIIGGLLGGLGGAIGGREVAGVVTRQVMDTLIPPGSNADEVVAEARRRIGAAARSGVEKGFRQIDKDVFENLEQTLSGTRERVSSWTKVL